MKCECGKELVYELVENQTYIAKCCKEYKIVNEFYYWTRGEKLFPQWSLRTTDIPSPHVIFKK